MAGRVSSADPGRDTSPLPVIVDGQACEAYVGDTVAAVLYRMGRRAWRRSRPGGPRGLLCGMGICFDCLVTVDDAPGIRACQTLVVHGMRIDTSFAEMPVSTASGET